MRQISRLGVAILLLALRAYPQEPKTALDPESAQKLYEGSQALREEKKYLEAAKGFARIAGSGLPGELPSLSAYEAACSYGALEKNSVSLGWLEKAVSLGYRDIGQMTAEADLALLREEDRYKKLAAKLLRIRDGGTPLGSPVQTLSLGGEDLEVYEEEKDPKIQGEVLAYQVIRAGEPLYLIMMEEGKITRIRQPGAEGEELAGLAPEIQDRRAVLPLADLLWEAVVSHELEKRGDGLLEQASTSGKAPEAAYAAYEAALHPHLVRPTLYGKLAEPYLKLIKDRSTPRALLLAAARSIANFTEGDAVEETGALALARASTFFFLRAYPLAAERLKDAEAGSEAEGLREVLKALGVNDWAPGETKTVESWPVTIYAAQGKPDEPGLPVFETAILARKNGMLLSFLLTRRKFGEGESYVLHVADGGSETLLEGYGRKKPSAEELEGRIAQVLRERSKSSLDGGPPARRSSLPPLRSGEPGRVEVRWGGQDRTERLEVRRESLEAALWLGASSSPVGLRGLAPGVHEAVLRDMRGRVLAIRRITVEPGEKAMLDLDHF